jgi:hypothetical protein
MVFVDSKENVQESARCRSTCHSARSTAMPCSAIIIGAGPAGLSDEVMLSRKRKCRIYLRDRTYVHCPVIREYLDSSQTCS